MIASSVQPDVEQHADLGSHRADALGEVAATPSALAVKVRTTLDTPA
jgi:hypothetical protein